MSLLATAEAAERLGVSTRQVQYLVARGELRQLARGVIDEASVDLLLAVRGDSHTRAWSEATAWGAVALLSGINPTWMGESQRSRLRNRLRSMHPGELVERARERASVTRYSGHVSTMHRIRDELVDTSHAGHALGLADTHVVDGYLGADVCSNVVARHGLIRDEGGQIILRSTHMDLSVVAELAEGDVVLAAIDLAESLDVRERRAGLDALEQALVRIHG